MDLYEHQGKELFARHGIPLVDGSVAESAEQARQLAERLGGKVVVKVQVQIGGRGKGGGIALVGSPEEAEAAAARMLTEGFRGTKVTRVLVERLVDISEQFYAAISLDRCAGFTSIPSLGCMPIRCATRWDTFPGRRGRGRPRCWQRCTRSSRQTTRPSSRSTRWLFWPMGGWSRSTRRSRSTTTRCGGIPSSKPFALRTPSIRWRPGPGRRGSST